MGKMRRKADLPTKDCLGCGRPFAWRRKWLKDWEAVKFCSDRCRGAGRRVAAVPDVDRGAEVPERGAF